MVFDITLYISLSICVLGLLYRLSGWFRNIVGLPPAAVTTRQRMLAAIKGCLFTLLSPKIGALLKSMIVDVLFQARIFRDKKDIFVWVMHLMIFVGFTLLLFMHALDRFVTSRLFEEYYATLNPFLFLRNLFGSAVLIGLILSVIRRLLLKKTGLVSSAMDVYAIVILAIITLSGFVVEGAKISSYSAYEEMIEEYASLETQEEARALEAVWVKEFGLVSPHDPSTDDTDTIVLGKELHEVSCSGCHAKPNWAFVSYAAAKITKPVALELDRIGFG